MAKGRIVISDELCKGCELCTSVCPKDLIEMAMDRFTPKGYHPAALIDQPVVLRVPRDSARR